MQLLGNLLESGQRLLLGAVQHTPQVLHALLHVSHHPLTLHGRLRTLVEGGPEGLADLPDMTAQLVSLEEQDEHHLVQLQALK